MKATLSVVSHGHGPLLQALLRDLCRQDGIADCSVVVTLNLATEVLEVAAYPQLAITVLRNAEPKGFGANHNAAFLHCRSPWFVVVNPDIRLPDATAVARLLRFGSDGPSADTPAVESGVRVGLRAPVVTNSAGQREDSVRAHLTPLSLLRRAWAKQRVPLRPAHPAVKGVPFFWLAGMFMAIRSDAFREVGGFDERFFLYCEDYDLCARLYLTGHGVVLDDTVSVVHDAQRDSHRSGKHLRWHLESLFKVWTSRAFWRVCWHG